MHNFRRVQHADITPTSILCTGQGRIIQIDSRNPLPELVDSFKRKHDYLRISLTERCNLRCFYCMPSEGVQLSPAEHILTDDEIIHLATLFVRSGITKIRLTGGEPTIRKGLSTLIKRLDSLRSLGLTSIAMTSNGLALHRQLPNLVDSGLTHLNLSLDTLDPFKFEIMTRRLGHDAVLKTLGVALSCRGLQSVKLNVVVVKGLNDSEVLDFVNLTRDRDLWVRFIEFMPFSGNKWDRNKVVPSADLLAMIRKRHPSIEQVQTVPSDTARLWKVPGHKGGIGFISSMSDHFCSSCNRLRITADGKIKVCLFDPKEISLRDEMRRGANDTELLEVVRSAVWGKKEKHAGMDNIDTVSNRPMILIGAVIRPSNSVVATPTSHLARGCDQRRWSTRSATDEPRLTHIDATGQPSMVDVSSKEATKRSATAIGHIYIPKIAYDLVLGMDSPLAHRPPPSHEKAWAKSLSKGPVLTVAQLAAIMGCKRTPELIPLCHPLPLSNISVTLTPEATPQDEQMQHSTHWLPCRIKCIATVTCEGKTGVEMEALTAVSIGLLTVWDMLKAIAGKDMAIGNIMVSHKSGGKSGDFVRDEGK
ncbi:hypothetical protein M404DRAFT_14549 [Pisolithus tinctorius Marx 270]|uniref:Radical SAM core domain-containing protein n=1 Tax=Pisolithus tinctorius Marx 270 TaxID=870435 RepID=A0A0C3P5Q5_PISTI|nr:hypothetical protein M404DRAFT_14549 [Pisolithus tinctorius Marx 270]